jgi:hypothetical protein
VSPEPGTGREVRSGGLEWQGKGDHEQLCNFDVSCTQVSLATRLLGGEQRELAQLPAGGVPHLFLNAGYGLVRHLAGKFEILLKNIGTMGRFSIPEQARIDPGLFIQDRWWGVLESAKGNSLDGIRLITSDACTCSKGSSLFMPDCALHAWRWPVIPANRAASSISSKLTRPMCLIGHAH